MTERGDVSTTKSTSYDRLGIDSLILAIVRRAFLDSRDGDKEAGEWLRETGVEWLKILRGRLT